MKVEQQQSNQLGTIFSLFSTLNSAWYKTQAASISKRSRGDTGRSFSDDGGNTELVAKADTNNGQF